MTTIRDTIDRAIGAVVSNASNFPERAQTRILGQDMAPLRARLTSAVIEALSTPPADDVCEAPDDLTALEAKARAATPGPWMLDGMGEDEPEVNYWAHRFIGAADGPDIIATSEDGHGPNAEYIAAASPDAVLALIGRLRAAEARPRGTVTDAEVEAAARAMFEDPTVTGDGYTWAEMVKEDPSRADIWRADARRVLDAARGVRS